MWQQIQDWSVNLCHLWINNSAVQLLGMLSCSHFLKVQIIYTRFWTLNIYFEQPKSKQNTMTHWHGRRHRHRASMHTTAQLVIVCRSTAHFYPYRVTKIWNSLPQTLQTILKPLSESLVMNRFWCHSTGKDWWTTLIQTTRAHGLAGATASDALSEPLMY